MGQDPILTIINIVIGIYAFIVVLRFLLQVAKADYYNPISQAVVRLTATPLAPIQKTVPKIANVDISPLLLAFAVFATGRSLVFTMIGYDVVANISAILIISLVSVFSTILEIYFWAVLGSVIISWVAPGSYHPGPQLITQLTEPLFKLTRKVVPPLGGLDFSPILIFIIIQIINSQLKSMTGMPL